MSLAIEMRSISKHFSGFKANDGANLSVERGTIHAILGENGAGKSTLMNILYGVHQPDEGEIFVRGRQTTIDGPIGASRLGIGMVHQHFTLVEDFTVAENVVLGFETSRYGWFSHAEAERRVESLSRAYGLQVDPRAPISSISVGMQQRVEILKVLHRGADILILDEPTAVLSPHEIAEFLDTLKQLAAKGKTILFITHKLKEILRACTAVTVLRRGRTVHTAVVSEVSEEDLAVMMVGSKVSLQIKKQASVAGENVLQVRNLVVKDSMGVRRVKGCNLDVRAGEIVGLMGVDGNGQRELVGALTGMLPVHSGSIRLRGKELRGATPRSIMEAGVGHIPEDRRGSALVMDCSVTENMILRCHDQPNFSHAGFFKQHMVEKYVKRLTREYDVRTPSLNTPIRFLSGGNQQKAVVAREIDLDPVLLLAVQPTRGVDVVATAAIHQRLIAHRNRGRAILLVSLELDEILLLSDRLAVMAQGVISGWLDPNEATEESIGMLMASGTAASPVEMDPSPKAPL